MVLLVYSFLLLAFLALYCNNPSIYLLTSLDTIVYAVRGRGTVVSEGGKKRQILDPGDFALVPAYTEHQEVNDGDEEVLWIITRSGKSPIVENLENWGKS